MLSMVAPGPRTHCLCEVIHIWSSLLLLIITHHYYKQVQSWLPSFWLQGKKKNILNFQRYNLEGFRFTVTGCCPVRTVNSLSWSMWARHVHLDWTPLKPSPSVTPLWCKMPNCPHWRASSRCDQQAWVTNPAAMCHVTTNTQPDEIRKSDKCVSSRLVWE